MATVSISIPRRQSLAASKTREYVCHVDSGLSLPLHYWLRAAFWAGIIMLGTSAIYVIEKYVLHLKGTPYRMVSNPSEFAIRFFGLSHYCVATYLMVTSKKIRHVRGMLMLGLFALLAITSCSLFWLAGGGANKVAVVSVFFFFLMHALRDEVFFYRLRSGKAIEAQEQGHVYKMSIWFQAFAMFLLAGILYPVYVFRHAGNYRGGALIAGLESFFPATWPLWLQVACIGAPFLVGAAFAFHHIQRNHEGGIIDFLISHRPLAIICISTVLLSALAVVLGSWILNFVILIHFTGWFVFAVAGIMKQPESERAAITWRTPNVWIRRNLVGFWCFHGGLAAMFFCLIAFNHWGIAQLPMVPRDGVFANPLNALFSADSLFYWTIAHVTLGFMPTPAPTKG